MRTTVRTLLSVLGAVILVVTMAAACGSKPRSGGPGTSTPVPTVVVPSTAEPTASSITAPASSTTAPATTAPKLTTLDLRVYFLLGDHIAVAHRNVPSTVAVARAAMVQLLAGPSPSDVAAGLSTVLPSGTTLLGVSLSNGTATVDLSSQFASGGGTLSMTGRLAQVTYTLTQFPTVTGVLFELDGHPLKLLGGEGVIVDRPATRASFDSLAPPILAEFPGRGWAVHSPVWVSGSANVYEAQFQAEITDSHGKVVAQQAITATSGTGTRGTFDTAIAYPSTAAGPGTLSVFDLSPKDGNERIDVVNIPLQLS